jgi:hypothetical protein
MPRETREERLVRLMIPQLTESLIELKTMQANGTKESYVEAWCRRVMKSVLGFSASAGYDVRTQETRGKMRFDVVVTKLDNPEEILLVGEIKRLGSDLARSDFRSGKTQLNEYLKLLGNVRWGILTNGYEWRLYDFKTDSISILSLDIRSEHEEIDTSSKAVSETAWALVDFCAYYFETKDWEKLSAEAQALSPESLARGVLSLDILKKIAKYLNEEFDYRVSLDTLSDKLAALVERGLTGLAEPWNEVKKAELEKYVRSQQRQIKKSRQRRGEAAETEPGAEAASTPEATPQGDGASSEPMAPAAPEPEGAEK